MNIAQPYLLFLGDVTDPLAAKTARGIVKWRPDACLGELRLTEQTVSLGLEPLSLGDAKAMGAKNAGYWHSECRWCHPAKLGRNAGTSGASWI